VGSSYRCGSREGTSPSLAAINANAALGGRSSLPQQQPRLSDATSVTSRSPASCHQRSDATSSCSPVCTPPRIQMQGSSTAQVTPRVPSLIGQWASPKRSTNPVMLGANTTPQTRSALVSSLAEPTSCQGEHSSLATRTSHSAPAGAGRLLQPGGLQRLQLQSRQQPAERQQQQHRQQPQPQPQQQQQQGLLASRSAAAGLPGNADASGNVGASRSGRSPTSKNNTGPALQCASGSNMRQLGPHQASGCCATRGSPSATLGRGVLLLQNRAGTVLHGPQQSLGGRTLAGGSGAPPPSTRSPGLVTLGVRERSSSPVYSTM